MELDAKDVEEVGVIPGGFQSTRFDTDAARGVSPQQVQREFADQREVCGTVADPGATGILAKRHIQHPMDLVFNSPMAAYRLGDRLGIAWQTGEIVARMPAHDAVDAPLPDHFGHTAQVWPHPG